jgi:hypothetical protein
MGWVPVSEHGINAAAPLHTVPAMSVAGSTLYAAGYSSDSGTEIWKASVGDERWTRAVSIPTLQRPLTMVLHAGALYVGGYDNTLHSMLVRISLDDVPDIRVLALPVAGIGVRSLLSMDSYLFLTIGGRSGGQRGRMSAGLGKRSLARSAEGAPMFMTSFSQGGGRPARSS